MKRLLLIFIAMMTITMSFGQDESKTRNKHEIFLKGSFGTSWIILPKVFIIDEDNPSTNAQILPATNSFSGNLGLQTVFHLGNSWLFVPEVDISYTSGEIRVNLTRVSGSDSTVATEQNLQSYVRAEIPLHFGVRSRDNFWVSFGPTLYFTLHDNKGFDDAVLALPPNPDNPYEINSDNPFGVRFRLAAYAPVGDRSYIDIKFESDLGQYFRFSNNTYEAKFSFQNIHVGYGFMLNK